MRRLVPAIVALITIAVVVRFVHFGSTDPTTPPVAVPTAAPLTNGKINAATATIGIVGTAQGAVIERDSDENGARHVDIGRTITRLEALHANTYEFQVEAPTDWGDLTRFMPAAQAAGIRVIAYLVPPTECPGSGGSPESRCGQYMPYHNDYKAWGIAVANLSRHYPDLIGWSVDDMDYNLGLFSPGYVAMINAGAQAVQPGLSFFLQLYEPSLTAQTIAAYASGCAGVIMPFRDGANADTTWASTLASEVAAVSEMLKPYGRKLIVMVYGNRLSLAPAPPDSDYVADVVGRALAALRAGTVAGVIVWNLELADRHSDGNTVNLARTGTGALVVTAGGEAEEGESGSASATASVTLDPGSTSCTLTTWRKVVSGAPGSGYELEALASGTVVWSADIGAAADWGQSAPVDLGSHFQNGSGSLTLRMVKEADAPVGPVTVSIDDVTLTGCGTANPTFELDEGWTLSRDGDPVVAGIVRYSPTYTLDAFTAVAALYGQPRVGKSR